MQLNTDKRFRRLFPYPHKNSENIIKERRIHYLKLHNIGDRRRKSDNWQWHFAIL